VLRDGILFRRVCFTSPNSAGASFGLVKELLVILWIVYYAAALMTNCEGGAIEPVPVAAPLSE
jgi:bacteriorhodopsin